MEQTKPSVVDTKSRGFSKVPKIQMVLDPYFRVTISLWSQSTMKKISERCRGWLETEEETKLKNHLRWDRIRVRGPTTKISAFIELADENNIFSLLVWVEAPTTYQRIPRSKECNKQGGVGGVFRDIGESEIPRSKDKKGTEFQKEKFCGFPKGYKGESSHIGMQVPSNPYKFRI